MHRRGGSSIRPLRACLAGLAFLTSLPRVHGTYHNAVDRNEVLHTLVDTLDEKADNSSCLERDAVESVCGVSSFAPESICPNQCPYMAELQDHYCHFKCVVAEECGSKGAVAEATIPDRGMQECRRCYIKGCAACNHGTLQQDVESCSKCMFGYIMVNNGQTCKSVGDWVSVVIFWVVTFIALIAIALYVNLAGKPTVNDSQASVAQAYCTRTLVRQQGVPGRPLWPISTNLNTTDVSGVGTMFFFRFQTAVLLWATFGFLLFLVSGWVFSPDLFLLGIENAMTPQQLCSGIRWGQAKQLESVALKVIWISFMYPFSIVGAFIYAVTNQRLYRNVATGRVDMSQYVAGVTGIPKTAGDENIEENLKEAIGQASGEKVVGVSCTWDYHDHSAKQHVARACEYETDLLGTLLPVPSGEKNRVISALKPQKQKQGSTGRFFDNLSLRVVAGGKVDIDGLALEHDPAQIKALVDSLCCTGLAFVVFESEEARDRAKEKLHSGFGYGQSKLYLVSEDNEPEGIVWEHCGVPADTLMLNLTKAVCCMSVTVVMLTVLLYILWERYAAVFSFAIGDEPGDMAGIIFVGLVVASQTCLRIVAKSLAHHIGFQYKDSVQRAYLLLCAIALIAHLVLCMGLTCFLSYHQLAGRGVRTADGVLLGDLSNFQMIFESYLMQKSIGNQLLRYSWPASFCLSVSAVPAGIALLQQHVGRLMIRSNPHLSGRKAEKLLMSDGIDLGRYATLMVNATLACFALFVAPAYLLLVFGAMIFSHICIYAFDHVRTLRSYAQHRFTSDACDVMGQRLFAVPCALLAAALVFNYNQLKGDPSKPGSGPLKGENLLMGAGCAFLGHLLLHLMLIEFGVQMIFFLEKRPEERPDERPYSEGAKIRAATWFSTNPVHCLRSKYVYKHDPPQTFYVPGKEHLTKTNAKIGAYFEEEAVKIDGGCKMDTC